MQLVLVFAFDHDANEGFGAGGADHDAAFVFKFGFQFANFFLNPCVVFVGVFFLVVDFGVDEDLGVGGHEGVEFAHGLVCFGHDFQEVEAGGQAVAGGVVAAEDDVAGLFAAEDVAFFEHFFQDVAVADFGLDEVDAFFFEEAIKADVGHDGADDGGVIEFAFGFEAFSADGEDVVAVEDIAFFVHGDDAVGVAVEGEAHVSACVFYEGLNFFGGGGAALGVDVGAVGGGVDGHDFGAEPREDFFGQFAQGAVSRVDGDFCAGKVAVHEAHEVVFVVDDAGQVFFLLTDGFGIDGDRGVVGIGEPLFDFFFHGVGEFESFIGEDFDAVVFEGVVGCGDDDAHGGAVFSGEVGDAGGGNDGEVRAVDAACHEACGEGHGEHGAGLSRVSAGEDEGLFGAGFVNALGQDASKFHGKFRCKFFVCDAADAVGSK